MLIYERQRLPKIEIITITYHPPTLPPPKPPTHHIPFFFRCSMKYDLRSMYDAVLIGNSPAADAAWTHGFYGASSSASSHFAHSSSSNLAGMATIRKRDNNKRRSQLPNPKKVYEEAQMSRKVSHQQIYPTPTTTTTTTTMTHQKHNI